MNKKSLSFALVAFLLISMAAAFSEMAPTVKAATATTLTITASSTSICANNVITLTATVNGGSNPDASSITWQTSSSGTFGVKTSSSNTCSVTYDDPGATSPITVTITASYPGDEDNGPSSNTITLTIYNTVDFNQDGKVNFNDVLYFIQAYIAYNTAPIGTSYTAACDLNQDGTLNFNDILLFVGLYDAYAGSV